MRLLLALGLFLVGCYWLLPNVFVDPLFKLNRQLSGLTAHQIEVGDHQVHYLAGGEGQQVLVLLHGIFADKDHWVEFVRPLRADFRILIPDLPGFGASSRLDDASYDYQTQAERLHAFLQLLEVETFHLAGNSMGGTLAARYALDHPQRVASLALIGGPHGVKTAVASEMQRRVEQGEIPLIARNQDEFVALLDLLFVKRPWWPRPLYKQAADQAIQRAESNVRLWQQQQQDPFYLQQHLAELSMPVFTLWGEQDRVFDASGLETLRENLPDGQHELMPQMGHLPMMEAPAAAARRYQAWLASLEASQE